VERSDDVVLVDMIRPDHGEGADENGYTGKGD
jgi:hypothetical protein